MTDKYADERIPDELRMKLTMPDWVISMNYYYSDLLAISAKAHGCLVVNDGEYLALWLKTPPPAIYASVLDLTGCLDADFTQ